jgi:hypothetical protein
MKSSSLRRRRVLAGLLVTAFVAAQPAFAADERESIEAMRETTLNLIDALVEQKVFTREQADAMVKAAQAKAARTVAANPPNQPKAGAPVRVQYVPQTVKDEIREQLRQDVLAQAKAERWAEPNAVPAWLDRIKWEGDIRLRYETDRFDKSNATPDKYIYGAVGDNPTGSEVTRAAGFTSNNGYAATSNTGDDRERFRVRARLGMLASISDEWAAGIRLATGNTTDRVSTNQTLGQDFNKYQLVVDRAYITYKPTEWLSATGGRIANPFFSTDLVWDDDLGFEGFAATIKPTMGNTDFQPFLTAGAFPLREENPPTQSSRWVQGVQAGAKWLVAANTRLTFGAALYDFKKLEGQVENNEQYLAGNTANYGQYQYGSSLRQKGNTLFRTNAVDDVDSDTIWGLASKFRPLNLTASVDLAHFDPVHVVLSGDFVKNTAFDRNEIQRRTGVTLTDGKDYGYLYKMVVGMPKLEKRNDWQASFAYRFLGSDATVDAFTDSDFGLGGTNLKGYVLGMSYAVDQNAFINVRWMSAQSIDSFSLNPSDRFAVDVLQADVNVRF